MDFKAHMVEVQKIYVEIGHFSNEFVFIHKKWNFGALISCFSEIISLVKCNTVMLLS